MIKCRYFPECQRCNEVGDSWIPCSGGTDGIQCDAYEPMPDVDDLLALADEMDAEKGFEPPRNLHTYPSRFVRVELLYGYARRIREALGKGES